MTAPRPLRPRVRRVLRHNALFDAMCARVDLRPARGLVPDGGRAFAQARSACLLCPAAGACEAWLARREDPAEPGAAPPFCPNRAYFETAAAQRGPEEPQRACAAVTARG